MLTIQFKRPASTMSHRLALPRHSFHAIALDANVVPTSRDVQVLDLSPGGRVDAVVEMNAPGVSVLGELKDRQRNTGLGVVVEYADQHGPPRWLPPPLLPGITPRSEATKGRRNR